ncbi:unknown [Anaerotruncus sp. CAG:390]|nr:unknown [Anaerotruncus sp. CAG:390]
MLKRGMLCAADMIGREIGKAHGVKVYAAYTPEIEPL